MDAPRRGEMTKLTYTYLRQPASRSLYTVVGICSSSCYGKLGCNNGCQVEHALRVAPLIVIPHDHFDEVLSHYHGECSINGVRVVSLHEVTGDQRLLLKVDDAFHGAVSGSLDCCVDILLGALLADLDDQVNNGDVGGGHPQSNAVQFALVLGQDRSNSLCSTGGGRHDVASTRTGTAQVTVPAVQDHLITSVRVGCRHHAVFNTEALVKDLADGGHAVGCARSVGDNHVVLWVVVALIDANHVCGAVLARSGEDHLLCASIQVLGAALKGVECSSRLNDHLNVQVLPRHGGRITARHDLGFLAIDGDGVIGERDISLKGSKHGVILQQVRGSLGPHRAHIDGHNVERLLLALQPAAKHIASNAAEAIDCGLGGGARSHRCRCANLLLAGTSCLGAPGNHCDRIIRGTHKTRLANWDGDLTGAHVRLGFGFGTRSATRERSRTHDAECCA